MNKHETRQGTLKPQTVRAAKTLGPAKDKGLKSLVLRL